MRWLLHDGNSLGYDFRDFEAVIAFVNARPHDTHFILTRASNVELFEQTLAEPRVTYIGYSKYAASGDRISSLAEHLAVAASCTLAFEDLSALAGDRAKLSSGPLKPTGQPYLRVADALVATYLELLSAEAQRQKSLRTLFCLVSGLKPVSDVGDSPEEHVREGQRQTLPLREIGQICAVLQEWLVVRGYAFVPLCVQYGARSDVLRELNAIQAEQKLRYPVRLFEDVDWTDNPHQQAAFYAALQRSSKANAVPFLAIGNASTYLHLLLGVLGRMDVIAVALHGYEVRHSRDGRAYWEELATCLPFLHVFRQTDPGDWQTVRERIIDRVRDELVKSLDLSP